MLEGVNLFSFEDGVDIRRPAPNLQSVVPCALGDTLFMRMENFLLERQTRWVDKVKVSGLHSCVNICHKTYAWESDSHEFS